MSRKSRYEIIKRNLNEDHLKEGIGSYIYTKPPKKINPDIFVNKKNYSKIKYESNAYYITQRVLYPDKDIMKPKPCTKRILSVEKNDKNEKLNQKKLREINEKMIFLENKENELENENINQLDEINKLIAQNEFLKNYYFNHEKEILNQKK